MKVLFIGEGLTDYFNQVLNKLLEQSNLEIFNLIDMRGAGRHIPAATYQSREGIKFTVVELPGTVVHKYSDESYWSYEGLVEKLREIKPDIISVSHKYAWMFYYDKSIKDAVRALNIKLILNDNPINVERYDALKSDILAGKRDNSYAPWYTQYFLKACERIGMPTVRLRRALLTMTPPSARRELLLKWLDKRKELFNMVDAHISYTERAYEVYPSYGVPKEKIFIRYNSPDTDLLFALRDTLEKEKPILPPNPHRLMHIGRLVPAKKVDMLLRSFADLKREFKDAELIVSGYGPEEENLKKLAEELGVKSSASFVGRAPIEDLGRYLLASAVYVLGGHGGLSLNDAMAFGKPVIVSEADGTEKHLVFEGINGLYFKKGDQNDLTQKIRQLFSNPELVAHMGAASTDIIKNKINIHTVVRGYMNAFTFVLGR